MAKTNQYGKNNPNWKGGEVEQICEQCSKIFKVRPNMAGKVRFCSQKCMAKKYKEERRGEKHPSWKGGKIKRICEYCGKELEVKPSDIKRGRGRFCSHSCNRKAQKMPTHHTKPERIFKTICEKYNLPFKYTGDGSFWIKNINPDFVGCNGKKIAVEIFGDYWHSPLLNTKLREDKTLPYRQKTLKRYGWELIVFWESDLKREDAEQFVLMTLKEQQGL